MTIKEALERKSPPRSSTQMIVMSELQNRYEAQIFERGLAILREAGIPGILEELKEAIKPNFPDVKIPGEPSALTQEDKDANKMFKLWANGTVSMEIGWRYRSVIVGSSEKVEYKTVAVSAEPLTESLVVKGMNHEIIPQSKWTTSEGRTILEDAIVSAYRNPGKRFWPPAMIL